MYLFQPRPSYSFTPQLNESFNPPASSYSFSLEQNYSHNSAPQPDNSFNLRQSFSLIPQTSSSYQTQPQQNHSFTVHQNNRYNPPPSNQFNPQPNFPFNLPQHHSVTIAGRAIQDASVQGQGSRFSSKDNMEIS